MIHSDTSQNANLLVIVISSVLQVPLKFIFMLGLKKCKAPDN
jgi:hypothetical protein